MKRLTLGLMFSLAACGSTDHDSTPDAAAGDAAVAVDAPACDPLTQPACQTACDPLDDNSFLGSGSDVVPGKTGTACGTSNAIGCYAQGGSNGAPELTSFFCSAPSGGYTGPTATGTLTYGSPVPINERFANSCAPGYVLSVSAGAQGSMQAYCGAFCAPANSFAGSGGTVASGPNGGSTAAGHSHQCNTTDARGAFGNPATPDSGGGGNGEHCVYSWIFAIDRTSNLLQLSPFSDTVGICLDHTQFQYDSNGDGNITTDDAVWPKCPDLPMTAAGSDNPLYAGFFGCVDHTHGSADGTPVHTTPAAGGTGTGFSRVLKQMPSFPGLPRH